ncbi:ADP-glyceromanno-heptose 6-epimerase [Candidatus Symbiobacter mobilis]|uniref:ADP-L-glycero-D-manno-heptose-6-epimerase n=1 Tax=Candidatus Symbiobacter mobilis CR TaxID=946483 RepID=U5N9V1_9BURK|nr:ADP-glyceromanno-heptose 6-epimerase [Candidatus Symbiobacter mobilis]AGX87023.1 ADP-L-glycero-D-manno-heptose 6-epimerase [Candidatus Symbiobacter mobilis CR]
MTRIVVTGAAGFIGSNLIQGLNARGFTDILAVDDLTEGDKFRNLVDAQITDYIDADVFYPEFAAGSYGQIETIFHQGACSNTMETDGKYMMHNNFTTSVKLYQACQKRGARLIYASSAATYGASTGFREEPACERPLNVYGYSKLLLDQRMRRECGLAFERAFSGRVMQVVGLRYFNVYGPREQHKGRMASVAFHQYKEFLRDGKVRLFGEYGGYGPGEQRRDFVYVDDVVAVNLWFFDHPAVSGIYNVGTGKAQPFNDLAYAVVNAMRSAQGLSTLSLDAMTLQGLIQYIAIPEALHGKYQCHTEADLTQLRSTGCMHDFADVHTGVSRYVAWMLQHG